LRWLRADVAEGRVGGGPMWWNIEVGVEVAEG